MSAPYYSFDPCVCNGMPCGACYPYSTKPCATSWNNLGPCSVCPGGGCSPCPAPVRPCPPPCVPEPVLPCLPPCPPCDKPGMPVPCPRPLCDSVAIPCCRPNRCKPCPRYCCTEPAVCCPKRCSYPGVPVCGQGCCGPCMPVWYFPCGFTSMSVLPRGYECFQPCPRYGCVRGEYSIYHKRPRCGQPRPQPFQREVDPFNGGPSKAPREKPCCYDFPCKADCFNHGACTRPSGRYARTVWYPGECRPAVPPCQAFPCPNPPYHPCCYYTCNKHV